MDRRNFVHNALMASGAAITGPFLNFDGRKPGNETLRLGIIGTGDRGTGLIRLIVELGGMEVVAVSDIIPERLSQAQSLSGGAQGYEDYRSLLDNKEIDAVMVCTPFSLHDEMVLDAMDAGKHVYCEKTMVKGLDELQQVVDKVKSSGKVFQVGHQYHSSPLYNKARNMIREGYLGKITAYHCQWNRNGDWRRPVHDPKWERMINWRMYKEYSGGLTAELCSHQIDFINWVNDSHPEKIVGFGGVDYWKDGRETYDNVHLLFEYPDGLDASFVCTTTNSYEDYKIRVLGEKGTIILDYTSGVIIAEPNEYREKGLVDGVSGATIQAWKDGKSTPIDAPGNDPTLDALRQFYHSIVDDAPVISDLKSGAITAKCVNIALEALYSEEVKHWSEYDELNFG